MFAAALSRGEGNSAATFRPSTKVLEYRIDLVRQAGLYGPAAPGQDAVQVVPIDVPFYADRSTVSDGVTLTGAGLWYVNVLTEKYPEREIRGQILPLKKWGLNKKNSAVAPLGCVEYKGSGSGSKPFHEFVEAKVTRLVELRDEGIGFAGWNVQIDVVDAEKRIDRRKGRALVSINEGVTQRKAFPESCRFLDKVSVVASLGTE